MTANAQNDPGQVVVKARLNAPRAKQRLMLTTSRLTDTHEESNMKIVLMMILTAFVLSVEARAAVSAQQEEAYDQTYKSDKAHEAALKSGDGLHH